MIATSQPPLAVSYSTTTLEERLERGEVFTLTACPFALPDGDDRQFLFEQCQSKIHKNISYNPHGHRLAGFCPQAHERTVRLQQLLHNFGDRLTTWLAALLPKYARHWQRDLVTLRPEEEAIRPLRLTARNDLLHVDAFPTRPSHGARILRVYVNINLHDPRVWVTSDTFGDLFQRFAPQVGLPTVPQSWSQKLRHHLRTWVSWPPWARTQAGGTAYDQFMLRFHHFLKANDHFQERSRKRYWKFPPNSVWLAFTDGVSHAVLRGRYAMEHSFFVPRNCLQFPELAPATIFEHACRRDERAA